MKNKHVLLTILLSFFSLAMMAQTFTLQGRVTDSSNNPVELATVAVAKQGRVTMTNLKGEYSIQLHSADSVVVRFSMVGYKTKTRVLRRPKGRQTLIVQLFDDNQVKLPLLVKSARRERQSSSMLRMRRIHLLPREMPLRNLSSSRPVCQPIVSCRRSIMCAEEVSMRTAFI